jgi:hypothetical protein
MTCRQILLERKSFSGSAPDRCSRRRRSSAPCERTARPQRKELPAQGAQPMRQAQQRRPIARARALCACRINILVKALLSAGVSDCQSDVGIAQPSSRIVNSIARRLRCAPPIIYFGASIT